MKIIAIAGSSGSGKSTLALSLQKECQSLHKHCEIVCEDRYYHPLTPEQHANVSEVDFDHPDALDNPLMTMQVKHLLEDKAIEIPNYSYATHRRTSDTSILAPPDLLILEGLHLLHRESLIPHYNAMIFVDTPIEVCLERRIYRDINERGRTKDSVISQFNKTVRPNFKKYIYPSRDNADFVIDGRVAIEETVEALKITPLFQLLSE